METPPAGHAPQPPSPLPPPSPIAVPLADFAADGLTLTVEVRGTMVDFKAFRRAIYSAPLRFGMQLLVLVAYFMGAALAVLLLKKTLGVPMTGFLAVKLIFLGMTSTALATLFHQWLARRFNKSASAAHTSEQLEIMFNGRFDLRPDGLFRTSRACTERIFWPAIVRIIETPEHIFVMVGKRVGYIIPKRCFIAPAAAEMFAEQLRAQRAAAIAAGVW